MLKRGHEETPTTACGCLKGDGGRGGEKRGGVTLKGGWEGRWREVEGGICIRRSNFSNRELKQYKSSMFGVLPVSYDNSRGRNLSSSANYCISAGHIPAYWYLVL